LVKQNRVVNSSDDVLKFDDRAHSYSRSGPRRKGSRKVPEDGLDDILETLYSEHRYLGALLDRLENESARLKPRRIPDFRLLLDIIDYLTHYPDQYHHPREDLLFGTLLKQDDEFTPILERLEQEHRELAANNHRLFNELTRVVSGEAADRPELLRGIQHYIARYRHHMDFESGDVFPRAMGTLSEADRKKLSENTRFIDDPLFGGQVRYQYKRLGRNLGAKVEALSEELVVREFSAIESTISRLSDAADTAGRLKAALESRSRQSWREQSDTIRRARLTDFPKLPLRLWKNHVRFLTEGIAEIREILFNGNSQDGPDRKNR